MSDGGQEAEHGIEDHDGVAGAEEQQEPSVLDVEREKHRRRAKKFGTEYVEPARRRDLRLEARKERFTREGFATGIDLFAEEEQQKIAARAQRFGLQSAGLHYVPPMVPEDEAKKRARAERFGVEYQPADETGLMDVDLLEQRQDVDPEVPRRHEAVHMYGVDWMSTADCLRYFADYGPTFVEWINDSCCNVLFRDAPTAKRAVVGLGRPLPPEEMPDLQGLDASDPANIELLWYKGEDFVKGEGVVPLIFRIATVRDVKPQPGEGEGRHLSRGLWKAGGSGGGQGHGRGRGQHYRVGRGRGRRQQQQQGREGEGEEQQEGQDADMRQQRQRGPRGGTWHKRRRDKDVDMADAEGEGKGGDGEERCEGQRHRLAGFEAASRRMFAAAFGGATGAAAPLPQREQVDYGDL